MNGSKSMVYVIDDDDADRAGVLGVLGLDDECTCAAVDQSYPAGGEPFQGLAAVGGRVRAVVYQLDERRHAPGPGGVEGRATSGIGAGDRRR